MLLVANRDVDALTPETALKCRLFIERSKAAGLDIFVTETLRSTERQSALYTLGRPHGKKVTYSMPGTGKHEFGLAFDVAFRGANLYPSDESIWARLGAIGVSCGLVWGGSWKSKDSVHFENRGGKIMGDIENGNVATSNNANEAKVSTTSTGGAAVEGVGAAGKSITLKDVAKYSGIVVLALPYLATFFPQYALFFKAVGAFIGVIGG